jgi:hypothetical protein
VALKDILLVNNETETTNIISGNTIYISVPNILSKYKQCFTEAQRLRKLSEEQIEEQANNHKITVEKQKKTARTMLIPIFIAILLAGISAIAAALIPTPDNTITLPYQIATTCSVIFAGIAGVLFLIRYMIEDKTEFKGSSQYLEQAKNKESEACADTFHLISLFKKLNNKITLVYKFLSDKNVQMLPLKEQVKELRQALHNQEILDNQKAANENLLREQQEQTRYAKQQLDSQKRMEQDISTQTEITVLKEQQKHIRNLLD